jgi:antitoxin PrlF
MRHIATVTSKGQITVPLAVRKRLGLKEGDQLEFVNEGGATVVRPVRSDGNPFAAYIGILGPLDNGMTSVEWVAEIRNDGGREEDLAELADKPSSLKHAKPK